MCVYVCVCVPTCVRTCAHERVLISVYLIVNLTLVHLFTKTTIYQNANILLFIIECSTISEYCTECSSADGEVFQCDNCKSGSFLTDNGCSGKRDWPYLMTYILMICLIDASSVKMSVSSQNTSINIGKLVV